MTATYSVTDAARIFDVREARLRYWLQTGFLWPSQREGGAFLYSIPDLVVLQLAVELLEQGIPLPRVRRAVASLRSHLPNDISEEAPLRICSDGDTAVALPVGTPWTHPAAETMADFFTTDVFDRIRDFEDTSVAPDPSAPETIKDEKTEPHKLATAYSEFQRGLDCEDAGAIADARKHYAEALELEPAMAAARINLGNLLAEAGELANARQQYEIALATDPDSCEARANLASLCDDLGETDLAVAELRTVCARHPDFPDAHYNLGSILARLGSETQARDHLERFLTLVPDGEHADQARAFLAA